MKASLKLYTSLVMATLLYIFCVIKISYIKNFAFFSLGVSIFIFITLCFLGVVINYKYIKRNIFLYIFCVIALICSMVNKNIDGTLLFILKTINIVLFVEYTFKIKKDKQISGVFYFLSTFFAISTLICNNVSPQSYVNNNMNYLIGSKFNVAYNAIASIVFLLYFSFGQKKIIYKILLLINLYISFISCYIVKCSTGIIGTVFILMLLILQNFKFFKKIDFQIMRKWYIPIGVLILGAIFAFYIKEIVEIPMIKYIIEDVLKKDSTLTGRTTIYENVSRYLRGKPLLGYGYNNIYEIFKETMFDFENNYAYNAQNALLEYMLYFGIFGCVAFFCFIASKFMKIKYECEDMKKFYLYGVYILMLMGIVEITIGGLFYLFLAFIGGDRKYKKMEAIKCKEMI